MTRASPSPTVWSLDHSSPLESNSIFLFGSVINPAGKLQIDATAPVVTSVVASGLGIDSSGNGDLMPAMSSR